MLAGMDDGKINADRSRQDRTTGDILTFPGRVPRMTAIFINILWNEGWIKTDR